MKKTIQPLKIAGYGLASSMLFSCTSAPKKQAEDNTNEEAKKPNIIYLMLDDAGINDFGCYGQKIIQTPNIDKLSEEGMKFTQVYCGTPVCAPSRCNLITGKHNGHSYIRGNRQYPPHGQLPLAESETTVAELLKEAEYATGMIGKWGLGIEKNEGNPMNHGWDFFYGYTDQVLAHNYYPEYLVRNSEHEMLDNKVKYLDTAAWHDGYGSYATKKSDYSNDLFNKEALKFIDKHKNNPFLLYLPYTIPHKNGEAPNGQKQEVPDYGIYADKDWESDTMGYAAMLTRLDGYVGELVAKLKEHKLDSNTLFIFTSDNGPMGEKTGFTKFFDSNGPYRAGKRDPYEGGVRMPFIARWPGKIKAGTVNDHITAFYDFLPTCCDLAGIETPEWTDGISYLPTLLGNDDEQKAHDYIYWEFHEGDGWQAIRKGKWKAVRPRALRKPDEPIELYDLSTDIGEENNIADKHPEMVEELAKLMDEAHVPSEEFAFDYE
jgi:arylsulfatase A